MKRNTFMAATSAALAFAAMPIVAEAHDRELQVFSDDFEWFAAYDYADLRQVLREYERELGYSVGGYSDRAADEKLEDRYANLDLASTHKCWYDEQDDEIAEHGDGELVEKTLREWTEVTGRGFMFTEEY